MGIGEEEFLIPPALSHMASSGPDIRDGQRHQHQHRPGRRKLLQPLCIAVGIFGVSTGAARYLFPRKKLEPLQDQSFVVRTDDGYTTSECATAAKVVMKGADLTKYYAMGHGEPAIFGFKEYETIHNGYKYWFQSEENKAKFEVSDQVRVRILTICLSTSGRALFQSGKSLLFSVRVRLTLNVKQSLGFLKRPPRCRLPGASHTTPRVFIRESIWPSQMVNFEQASCSLRSYCCGGIAHAAFLNHLVVCDIFLVSDLSCYDSMLNLTSLCVLRW